MSYYVNSGIYTNHALSKICEVEAGNTNTIYLTKIKLGDGNGNDIILDPSTTELINPVYTLNLESVIPGNDAYTFTATIPAYIEDFRIREVGIYETINNIDYLYAFSSVNIFKPSGLDYDLIIEVRYNLNVTNVMYDLIKIGMNEVSYLTKDELEVIISNILTDFEDNISRVIEKNHIKLTNGNIENDFSIFNNTKYTTAELSSIDSACKLNKFISNNSIAMNCYFNNNTILNEFIVNDLSFKGNNITVTENSKAVLNPNMAFHDSNDNDLPFTINISKDIVNLQDDVILEIENYMKFYIEDKTLIFKLYGANDSYYEIQNILDVSICGLPKHFTVTYNGDKNNPNLELYIDGINISGIKINNSYEGLVNTYAGMDTIPLIPTLSSNNQDGFIVNNMYNPSTGFLAFDNVANTHALSRYNINFLDPGFPYEQNPYPFWLTCPEPIMPDYFSAIVGGGYGTINRAQIYGRNSELDAWSLLEDKSNFVPDDSLTIFSTPLVQGYKYWSFKFWSTMWWSNNDIHIDKIGLSYDNPIIILGDILLPSLHKYYNITILSEETASSKVKYLVHTLSNYMSYREFGNLSTKFPPPPSNINFDNENENVTLSWECSYVEDVYFEVYRSDALGGLFEKIGTSNLNERSYTVNMSGLSSDSYFFKVRSFNNVGYSIFSDVFKYIWEVPIIITLIHNGTATAPSYKSYYMSFECSGNTELSYFVYLNNEIVTPMDRTDPFFQRSIILTGNSGEFGIWNTPIGLNSLQIKGYIQGAIDPIESNIFIG